MSRNAPVYLDDEQTVEIDVQRLIETRGLLTAGSGAGKSYTIRYIEEQVARFVQSIVFDPEGEFHTLRERHDFFLIGRGGDAACDIETAAQLARTVLDSGISVIIDLSDLRVDDKVDHRAEYIKRFIDSMMTAKSDTWHDILVVIDEVHIFAPERGATFDPAVSTAAIVNLATRGRKKGFALFAATQRLAELRKSVSAELHNRMIGRILDDNDLASAAKRLGLKRIDVKQLTELEDGEFFVVGPALSKKVVMVKVGTCQTTHPRRGTRGKAPTPPPARVKQLLSQLTNLPKEPVDDAQVVVQLRARIAELTNGVRSATDADRTLSVTVDKLEGDNRALQGDNTKLTGTNEDLRDQLKELRGYALEASGNLGHSIGLINEVRDQLERTGDAAQRASEIKVGYDPTKTNGAHARAIVMPSTSDGTVETVKNIDGQLTEFHRNVLVGVRILNDLGIPGSASSLSVWIDIDRRNKAMSKALVELRGNGYLVDFSLTTKGTRQTVEPVQAFLTDLVGRYRMSVLLTIQKMHLLDISISSTSLATWMKTDRRNKELSAALENLRDRGLLDNFSITLAGERIVPTTDKGVAIDWLYGGIPDDQLAILNRTRAGVVGSATELADLLGTDRRNKAMNSAVELLRDRGLLMSGWPLSWTDAAKTLMMRTPT